MSNAIRAIGHILAIGDGGSPEMFTQTISEVLDINGPGLTRDLIDVTNQGSTGDFREFITGAADAGELTFDINYHPTESSHDASTGLISLWVAGTTDNYRLEFPDASPGVQWTFAALVTNFAITANINEQLKASVTLRITGSPTLA